MVAVVEKVVPVTTATTCPSSETEVTRQQPSIPRNSTAHTTKGVVISTSIGKKIVLQSKD